MDYKKKFADILKDDPLGLIGEVKPKATTEHNEDSRLVASFEEINAFYKQHQRIPQQGNVQESSLFFRLKGIQEQSDKVKALKKYDCYNLLTTETDYTIITLPTTSVATEPRAEQLIHPKPAPEAINSIEDIFANDELGLFEEVDNGIFNLKHVKKEEDRAAADFIARRKPCKNFDQYETLFQACQADLKTGKRKLVKFKENQLQEGAFFTVKGVLCYLAQIKKISKDKNGKIDGRTLTIFENGTQSNMRLRSLGKAVFDDGWGVTYPDEASNKKLVKNVNAINESDTPTGFIYVLRSKSKVPQIASINNLYKIGYSSMPVEQRIKNAAKEPTYLMAPVHILNTYEVFNIPPNKLEHLLHRFFGRACLDVHLEDGTGKIYRPREWFVAPLEVIEQAVAFIINGEIVKWRYDVDRGEIVGR